MANIHADITPTGIDQRYLVRLLRYFFAALEGVAAKLDLDDNADNTYEATYNALHSVIIEDDIGNRYQNVASESSSVPPVAIIGPKGMGHAQLCDILYQLHFAFYTMLAQCDSDDMTTSNYVTTCWTSKIVHRFENRFGTLTGDGTVYYFKPGGVTDHRQLVDALYNFFYYWDVFLDKLDTDAKPAGANYATLWSDTILLRILNTQGNTIGNTNTRLG